MRLRLVIYGLSAKDISSIQGSSQSPIFLICIQTADDALTLMSACNQCREARMDEVRALSALLSDFQRLVSSQSSTISDQDSRGSKRKSEEEEEGEEEERTSRTSSSRSASTLSYFGGSEASSSVSVMEEKSNRSSPPSLPVSPAILNKRESFLFVSFLSFLCISPGS